MLTILFALCFQWQIYYPLIVAPVPLWPPGQAITIDDFTEH